MTGKFLISMTFAIAYLYTAELFPTKVRNLAVGLASTFARIGSISAPYIVDLLVSSKSNTKCIGPKLQCHAFVSFGNSSGPLSNFFLSNYRAVFMLVSQW